MNPYRNKTVSFFDGSLSVLLIAAIASAFRFYYLAKNAVMGVPGSAIGGVHYLKPGETGIRYSDKQVRFSGTIALLFAAAVFYLSLGAFHGIQAGEFENCTFESTAIKETTFEDAKISGSGFDASRHVSGSSLSLERQMASNAIPNIIDTFYGSGIQLRNVAVCNTPFKNHVRQ
jgi:hypothetical protein